MLERILHWVIATVAIMVTAALLPGVTVTNILAAFLAALVLGIINAFIKPILLFLTLPITVFTLGLFALVINAALVLLAAAIVPGFEIATFWSAILFSIVLSLVNWALYAVGGKR